MAQLGVRPGLGTLRFSHSRLFTALLSTSIFIMLCSVSFWFQDRVGVMPPFYNLIIFGRYPLLGDPRFGFATFNPAAVVLRGNAYFTYAWLLPVVTVLFSGPGLLVWHLGIRNYSSTGN